MPNSLHIMNYPRSFAVFPYQFACQQILSTLNIFKISPSSPAGPMQILSNIINIHPTYPRRLCGLGIRSPIPGGSTTGTSCHHRWGPRGTGRAVQNKGRSAWRVMAPNVLIAGEMLRMKNPQRLEDLEVTEVVTELVTEVVTTVAFS